MHVRYMMFVLSMFRAVSANSVTTVIAYFWPNQGKTPTRLAATYWLSELRTIPFRVDGYILARYETHLFRVNRSLGQYWLMIFFYHTIVIYKIEREKKLFLDNQTFIIAGGRIMLCLDTQPKLWVLKQLSIRKILQCSAINFLGRTISNVVLNASCCVVTSFLVKDSGWLKIYNYNLCYRDCM